MKGTVNASAGFVIASEAKQSSPVAGKIASSQSLANFVGTRNDKRSKRSTFTAKYHLTKLVYFETGPDIQAAIFREKQIKAGSRQNKIDLINSMNPEWKDLYDEYFKTS